VARRTSGLAGADLANLLNQAALAAARSGVEVITSAHLDEALATVVMGRERRSAAVTDRDRTITAWHEAGHAVAALLQPEMSNPVSVTIVPRAGAGGVTWTDVSDDQLFTSAEARARLVLLMAGRVAEELLLDGEFTQGAQSDFAQATRLARSMTAAYGMSSLGVAVREPDRIPSDAEIVAAEVDRMLADALSATRDLLGENRSAVATLAEALLEQETLSGDEVAALVKS
jgi:cell division protease FtsH